MQVNILIHIIIEPILNFTLQAPQYMLCNNQVNMSWICQELAQGVYKKHMYGLILFRYINEPII